MFLRAKRAAIPDDMVKRKCIFVKSRQNVSCSTPIIYHMQAVGCDEQEYSLGWCNEADGNGDGCSVTTVALRGLIAAGGGFAPRASRCA